MRDYLTYCLAWVGVALTVFAMIFLAFLAGFFNPLPRPHDIYESAYNACIARETIASDRCHDMALREAYGD